MSSKAYNDVLESVLSNPQAREVYYQERRRSMAERRERDALEQEAEEERQRQLLRDDRRKEKERLLSMPPAEAWMAQHEECSYNAPTRGALRNLIVMERLRLKATRERLQNLGVK